jgi:hypothetical protein
MTRLTDRPSRLTSAHAIRRASQMNDPIIATSGNVATIKLNHQGGSCGIGVTRTSEFVSLALKSFRIGKRGGQMNLAIMVMRHDFDLVLSMPASCSDQHFLGREIMTASSVRSSSQVDGCALQPRETRVTLEALLCGGRR